MIVATIYTNDQRSQDWYRLQRLFLTETTANFKLAAVLNGVEASDFPGVEVIGSCSQPTNHITCLEAIVGYLRRQSGEHCLVLDSDCWPIKQGWAQIIERMLAHRLYAAPVRTENYDLFPHPCAVFLRRAMLEHVNFGYQPVPNLFGYPVSDVGSAMPRQVRGEQIWLPLVRTNRWNPHPLVAAVYGHLFYHHGAGSRTPAFRCLKYGVYDHFMTQEEHQAIYADLTRRLLARPRQFISKLCRGQK